jgi:hypothetical protein
MRALVAAKCPARITLSSTRGLSKNRYAAFVAAQSWQADGSAAPILSPTESDGVDLTAFANISGQIVYTRQLAA